jgi:Tat protein secretion system quality control protein TatD with DNase activity
MLEQTFLPPRPSLFLGDIHRHLTAEQDFTKTIRPVLYCSTLPAQWPQIRELGPAKGGYGVHPWEVTAQTYPDLQNQIATLPALINQGKTVASAPCILGEIGLDLSPRYQAQKAWQMKILHQFLDLPYSTSRILNLHLVQAWGVVLNSPFKEKLFLPDGSQKIILHAFQGSREILRQLLAYPQVYFSYGLQHGAKDEVLKAIPLDRLMIESDLVRPTPPAQIQQILQNTLEHLAQLHRQTLTQMSEKMAANWASLFEV